MASPKPSWPTSEQRPKKRLDIELYNEDNEPVEDQEEDDDLPSDAEDNEPVEDGMTTSRVTPKCLQVGEKSADKFEARQMLGRCPTFEATKTLPPCKGDDPQERDFGTLEIEKSGH